jgi:hypothetical protein
MKNLPANIDPADEERQAFFLTGAAIMGIAMIAPVAIAATATATAEALLEGRNMVLTHDWVGRDVSKGRTIRDIDLSDVRICLPDGTSYQGCYYPVSATRKDGAVHRVYVSVDETSKVFILPDGREVYDMCGGSYHYLGNKNLCIGTTSISAPPIMPDEMFGYRVNGYIYGDESDDKSRDVEWSCDLDDPSRRWAFIKGEFECVDPSGFLGEPHIVWSSTGNSTFVIPRPAGLIPGNEEFVPVSSGFGSMKNGRLLTDSQGRRVINIASDRSGKIGFRSENEKSGKQWGVDTPSSALLGMHCDFNDTNARWQIVDTPFGKSFRCEP